MATTRIMSLHIGKGRTVGKAISDIIDYVENPDKTDGGRLISATNATAGSRTRSFYSPSGSTSPRLAGNAGPMM